MIVKKIKLLAILRLVLCLLAVLELVCWNMGVSFLNGVWNWVFLIACFVVGCALGNVLQCPKCKKRIPLHKVLRKNNEVLCPHCEKRLDT